MGVRTRRIGNVTRTHASEGVLEFKEDVYTVVVSPCVNWRLKKTVRKVSPARDALAQPTVGV